MRAFAWLATTVFATALLPPHVMAQRAVFLVRHAEKLDQGDGLTEHGKAQAETLARLLADAKITTVYTSQFERTKQTAEKLERLLASQGVTLRRDSTSLKLPDELLQRPEDEAMLERYARSAAEELRTKSPNEIVLVVGHDLTVPAIVRALGSKTDVRIGQKEFGHLFIVVPRAEGRSSSGMFHVPDYTAMRPQILGFSGTSEREMVSEATRKAVEGAGKKLATKNLTWNLASVESRANRLTATIEIDQPPGPEKLAPATSRPEGGRALSTFRGMSEQGDITEAVRNAIAEAFRKLPTDYIRWELRRFESGPEGLTAIIEASPPSGPGRRPGEKGYTGTSDREDVNEAIIKAIAKAGQAQGTSEVSLRFKSISGSSGGFANEKKVSVTVEPVAEPNGSRVQHDPPDRN